MAEVNEVVAEVAEEVADSAKRFAGFSRALSKVDRQWLSVGIAAGATSGFLFGYWLATKKMDKKYEAFYAEVADIEIKLMKEHYQAKEKVANAKPTLKELAIERGYTTDEQLAIDEANRAAEEAEEREAAQAENHLSEPEQKNVFEQPQPPDPGPMQWNYAHEVRMRGDDPYVIHADEYAQGEKEYEQVTFAYFAEDDVLCDERDQVVEDQDGTVGLANLDKFGHGSNDPNIVYVRNDALEMEFEVVKNDNSYAETVHGFVRHSFEPRRRGHRRFDDDD